MTTEHLRPLLDDMTSLHLFFRVSERLARAWGCRSLEIGEDHGIVEARRWYARHCGWVTWCEDWWRERLPNNSARLWNEPPALTSTPLPPGLAVSAWHMSCKA